MKAAEAKQRLLAASIRLIGEKGLAGLSFREMSRRAGVSHQTPYHHFSNREGILAAIAHEGFARLDERLIDARTTHRRKRPPEILRNVIRAYMNFAIENPVYYGVMFRPELVNFRRYPEARVQALLTFQRLVDSVAACHRGASSNDRRVIEVANALWAAAHGVATLWLDGPLDTNLAGIPIASFIDTTSEMFAHTGATTDRIAGAKPRRIRQKSSDKFSAASTTSSSTT